MGAITLGMPVIALHHAPATRYAPRNHTHAPLWQCLDDEFSAFIAAYEEHYQQQYGYLRAVIPEVVNKYLECGDLRQGFARVRCGECGHEYLLAFSCRGRWFCPSCHQKKVIQFGEFVTHEVVAPAPHRHYVFTIPVMLRVYFKNTRYLLKKLCTAAYESVLIWTQAYMNVRGGKLGMIMAIHTYGEYLNNHPHVHAVVADGLFRHTGLFHVLGKADSEPLVKIFQNNVLKLLVREGKLTAEAADKQRRWKHSGFSVYRSSAVNPRDTNGLERIAQYIIRSPFSLEKMQYFKDTKQVLYQSKYNKKTKRNFEVYKAHDFIAAITQHIPDKGFQMVRYYGWYSNKSRGLRKKHSALAGQIGIKEHDWKIVPSRTWCELIKKIWEVDPLLCPECGGKMRIISLINDPDVIEDILRHLGRGEDTVHQGGHDPPEQPLRVESPSITYEPIYDDFQNMPDEYPGNKIIH